ncbi:hypothetical protein [Deinococcus aetherius]|uniref:hypothetical protein n=1 Tax=Deinococcus aetherius TaxID=200252 RepID=UPI00222F3A7A|nr:hypothetical protein [Deinococcus aetherius]
MLRGAAAAQLCPENADRLLRLEAFAQAALSLPPPAGGRAPTVDELRGLIHTAGAVSGFSMMEDPSDNAFTEHLVVEAGDFVVFPGIEEEAVHSVEQLLTAALGLLRQGAGTPQLGRAVRSCLALLALSGEVDRRSAGHPTVGEPQRGVFLPDGGRLERLKDAVTYTEQDLAAVLAAPGLHVSDLAPFITRPGRGSGGEPGLDGGPLAHQPLVAIQDRYVFFPVGHVLRAVRHLLLTPSSFTAALEIAYYDLAWQGVQVSLRRMGVVQPLVPFAGVHTPLVRTRAFEIDRDKVLHLALVGDPFRNYRPHELFEPSDLSALQPNLDGSYAALEALHGAFPEAMRPQVFSLVVFEGLGNMTLLPRLGAETAYDLSVGASDLEVMSYDFEGDSLGLLYFAQAVRDMYTRQRLGMVGTLDLFDAYRRHGRSFYLSDQAPPTSLFLMPGGAGNVRRERRAELTAHGVPYGPAFTKVTNHHRDPSIGLFRSLEMLRGRVSNYLAEGDHLRIWVVAEHDEAVDVNLPLVAETVAFWLWQLMPPLEAGLRQDGPHLLRVVIEAVPPLPPDPGAPMPGLRVLIDAANGTVLLQVDGTFTANFTTPDNLPERAWMHVVLGAVTRVMAAHGLLGATRPDLDAAISDVMGDPARKKISVLSGGTVLLDGSELPRARVLQEHQESRALDFLADALSAEFPVGTVREGGDAPALLNAAVARLYGEFVRLVGTLDARQAVPYFVRQHEAIIHRTAGRQFTFDFTRRCYAGHPRMQHHLREEYGRNNRTAIASRFVIEYLAAQPPQGEAAPTLELHDRLIALAALIHGFGTNSDLAYHRLAHVTAEILPSGRLASERGAYEPARAAFETNMFGEVTRDSLSLARSYLGGPAPEDGLPDRTELNAAFRSETGWTLSDTLGFLNSVSALPGKGVLPRQMPLTDFLRAVAQDLGWDEGKVRALLDLLSLTPRPNFLRPPHPWRREDVEPWRFNRRLSYLRRPVLLLGGETPSVVWGPRAVTSASHYLLDLLQSGRFRADGTPLRQLLGEVNRRRGRVFNREVAAFLRALGFRHVQEQAKVLGPVRMRGEDGLDLGDIDVFVVDEARRRVSCVECKNFAVARTSAEIHALFERLERGTATERPIVERHGRRVEHVRQHLPAILGHFGLTPEGWEVEGFIVFNRDSVAYYLSTAPLPVLSFEQFVLRMRLFTGPKEEMTGEAPPSGLG